ncbi:DUF1697 domain-containing protein [Sinomonas sp. G460-2]|uniref:DUF1697 domain-containing protein n=1 Tax=Sinomonas sp. G460-2 TaxID=3393464 RepID=UPI0039EFB37B
MAVLCAVFYRNLNLGHRGSPTRAVLEAALMDAGAVRVASVQTNGTVLLETPDPNRVVAKAASTLERECGYRDAGLIRPFEVLASIIDRDPFEGRGDERTYGETFTFFDGGAPLQLDLPWTNERGDVDIFEVTHGIALSVIRRLASSPGSPNAEISRLTDGAVTTTRNKRTVERLVALGRAWRAS